MQHLELPLKQDHARRLYRQKATITAMKRPVSDENGDVRVTDWSVWLPVFFGAFGIGCALIVGSAVIRGACHAADGKLIKTPIYVNHV